MNLKDFTKRFVRGTVYVQAPLKAFELDENILKNKYGIIARILDPYNDEDIEIWKSIIHTSYDDCHYTSDSARALLTNHPYMKDVQTFLFQDNNGQVVSTVSIGRYRTNPSIGGAFRLGVTKNAQNKGYGKLCLLFAFSKLSSLGVKNGESAISFKRKESQYLHYALGFRPRYNLKYVAAQKSQLRMKNFNLLLKFRLYESYRSFLKREKIKYIKK